MNPEVSLHAVEPVLEAVVHNLPAAGLIEAQTVLRNAVFRLRAIAQGTGAPELQTAAGAVEAADSQNTVAEVLQRNARRDIQAYAASIGLGNIGDSIQGAYAVTARAYAEVRSALPATGTLRATDVEQFLIKNGAAQRSADLAGMLMQNGNDAFRQNRPDTFLFIPVASNEDGLTHALEVLDRQRYTSEGIYQYSSVLSLNGPDGKSQTSLHERREEVLRFQYAHPDAALSFCQIKYPDGTPIGAVRADPVEAVAMLLLSQANGVTVPNVILAGVDADVRKMDKQTLLEQKQVIERAADPDNMFVFTRTTHDRTGKNMDPIIAWEDFLRSEIDSVVEAGWAMTLGAYVKHNGFNRLSACGEVSEIPFAGGMEKYVTKHKMHVSPRRLYQSIDTSGEPVYGRLTNTADSHRGRDTADITIAQRDRMLQHTATQCLRAMVSRRYADALGRRMPKTTAQAYALEWLHTKGRVALAILGGPKDALDRAREGAFWE